MLSHAADPRNQTLLSQLFGPDVPGPRALGVARRLVRARAPHTVRSTGPYDVMGHALSTGRQAYVKYLARQHAPADLPSASVYARQASGRLGRVTGKARRTLDGAFAGAQGSAGPALTPSREEQPSDGDAPSPPPSPPSTWSSVKSEKGSIDAILSRVKSVSPTASAPFLRELQDRLRLLNEAPTAPGGLTPSPAPSDRELNIRQDLLQLPNPPTGPNPRSPRPTDQNLWDRYRLLHLPDIPPTPVPSERSTTLPSAPDAFDYTSSGPGSAMQVDAGPLVTHPHPPTPLPSSPTPSSRGIMGRYWDRLNHHSDGITRDHLSPVDLGRRTRTWNERDEFEFEHRRHKRRNIYEELDMEDLFSEINSLPDAPTDPAEIERIASALREHLSSRTATLPIATSPVSLVSHSTISEPIPGRRSL